MALDDRNKLNRIEELKGKLFSRNYQIHTEHHSGFTRPKSNNVKNSWGDSIKTEANTLNYQERFFMKTSKFKKFFIFSLFFFMLTLGYASFVFFFAGNTVSNKNIDISILGNSFTAGGEELSLLVGIANKNSSSLELVDLVVEYSKNGMEQSFSEVERFRQSLGSILSGALHNENVKLVLFGEQGDVHTIKVYIEYRVGDSNAIFVKEKFFNVTISSTPINLLVDAPSTISSNQNIVLKIKSVLNSTKSVQGIILKVDYPTGFQFTSSIPSPSISNNIWNMGDLSPGVGRDILISGKMVDVFDGEEKSFIVSSGSPSSEDKSKIGTVFNSLIHKVMVKKPFIEANILINNVLGKEYAVNSKDIIRGTVNWKNNLDTKIDDLEIHAKIGGNAFNTKTVTGEQGTYNSLQNTITWDKFSINEFSEINSGDSGFVNFEISPLSLFSSVDGILSDPNINIEVSVSGKQLIAGYEPVELNNSESKNIKIISDTSLNSKVLHYSGVFKNTGPIPPKAEKETTYTVSWSIANTSNNLSKTQVRAVLPSWVRFIGTISPSKEDITYNSSSREVLWNVGRITKGTGIKSAEKTVSFQVGLTPLFAQIKSSPLIINGATLTGHDDFANVDVKVSKQSINTDLKSDSSFPTSGGFVTE